MTKPNPNYDPERRLGEIQDDLIKGAEKAAANYLDNLKFPDILTFTAWSGLLYDADFAHDGPEAEIHAWTAFGPDSVAKTKLLDELTKRKAEKQLADEEWE